jgi:CHAT domain-containing protein
LTEGVMLAALRHALEVLEMGSGATGSQQWLSAAFSAVLIGTNGGRALSVETSLAAMVKGALLANRLLREQGMLRRVRIDEVEIVELYEDTAIRAAKAVGQLRDTLSLAPDESEALEPVGHLRSAEGGLPRGAPSTYDPDWWRRIQISETGPRAADGTSGLEFIMLTDRARAEQTLEATQRALIDRFVDEAVGQHRTAATQATTTALYELLLPNTIKEQAEETANLMLVLDDAAANYPWEMLRERDQEPLSVRYGMLRQLKTAQFRTGVRAPRGLNALVIGDPDAGDPRYPRLNGARMEAEQAAAELAKYGYVVDAQIGTSGLDVVRALYAREYRVIHIAAHGVYQVTQEEGRPSQVRTGVVIGKDFLLTAAEIAKLRPVPELVFLNCCHLAQTDAPVGEPGAAPTPFNKLAASLAKELIDIGVRAVVAAGWAVDDTAACEFAGEFYRHMLVESRQFGEAVRMARRRIYDNHQAKNNTWGAFQCYGMPSFTLSGKPQRDPRAVRPPVSKHEILDQLHQIRGDAENAERSRHKILLQRLQQNDRWLRSEWRTSDALYELAETYSALGELETAIGLYQAALDSEETRSGVPLRAVEQLANLELRRAEQLRRQLLAADAPPDPTAEKNRKRLLKNAEDRLELLLRVAENVERRALMAGYWKRMALSTDGDERKQALVKAAEHYKRAAERAADEHKPYPALNWVICQFLANEEAENAAQMAELLQAVAECERIARELQKLTTDYWKRVYIPDAHLLRALLTSTLDQEADAIVRQYQIVFRTRSTARERTTSLGHLDFVSAMLDARSPRLAATVRRVRKALEE